MATDYRTDDQEFVTFKEKFITKTKGIVEATDITNATDTDMIIAGALAESVRRVAPEDKVDIDSTVASQFAEKTFTRLKITDFDNVSDTDLIVNGALMEAANRIARPRTPILVSPPKPTFAGGRVKLKFILDNAADTLKATCQKGSVVVSGNEITYTAPDEEGSFLVSVVSVRNGMESVACEFGMSVEPISFTVSEYNANISYLYPHITVSENARECSVEELMDWLGIKPVVLLNGVEQGDVNPNNFKVYTSGATIPTTLGYDIMIKFPRRGIKVERSLAGVGVSDNTYTMTKQRNAVGYDYAAFTKGTVEKDCFYVGAYHAYGASSKIYSSSGKTPLVNTTLTNFRTYANNRNTGGVTGYQLWCFDMVEYIQTCYALCFQNLNSQNVIGYGRTNVSNGSAASEGACDTLGMNWGTKANWTSHMKLFGIEDFYGNIWTWVDGLKVANDLSIYKSSDNSSYNDSYTDWTGYTKIGTHSGQASGNTYYTKTAGGSNANKWFPTTFGASDGTGYGDGCWAGYTGGKSALFGGYWNNAAYCGVWCWPLYRAASAANDGLGARLAFF